MDKTLKQTVSGEEVEKCQFFKRGMERSVLEITTMGNKICKLMN